jgi:hypothetical protein
MGRRKGGVTARSWHRGLRDHRSPALQTAPSRALFRRQRRPASSRSIGRPIRRPLQRLDNDHGQLGRPRVGESSCGSSGACDSDSRHNSLPGRGRPPYVRRPHTRQPRHRQAARDRYPQPLTAFPATVRTARAKSGFKAGLRQKEKFGLEHGSEAPRQLHDRAASSPIGLGGCSS